MCVPYPVKRKFPPLECAYISSFGLPCEITIWCYNFDWVKVDPHWFACHMTGCERGVLYSW
ncbi:hypothetical protein YSY22_47000 [Brevibacillus formosus]